MLEFNLIGNLGSDATVQEKDGRKFVSFNVANTEKWTDQAGTTHETTDWVSCTINGDGGNLLPYLKAGTKVFVSGRGSTRIYSSPKLRQMVAGMNISVTRIELVGGIMDEVPRELTDPTTGLIKRVIKCYTIAKEDLKDLVFDQQTKKAVLVDKRNNQFEVDKTGFVSRIKDNEPQQNP